MSISQEQRAQLEEAACTVRQRAYAPYSRFRVGAAVLGADGDVYVGVNVENAVFGLTICAERAAIFKAVTAGERSIRAIAVCTGEGAAPCGSCRQVMREFAEELPVFLVDAAGNSRETTLSALLPVSFGPEDLPEVG